jgi:hypothetical protein
VHLPGVGASLLWDAQQQQPCAIVVKHFRNKWNESGKQRGPYADRALQLDSYRK